MKKLNFKILFLIALALTCIVFNNNVVLADNANYSSEQSVGVNEDMEDYIRLARRYVKNNWYPPTSSFEHTAKIALTVDKSGQLLDCKIIESSNDSAFDESLIEAAKKTKFAPLPKSYIRKNAELHLSFSMQRHHVSR